MTHSLTHWLTSLLERLVTLKTNIAWDYDKYRTYKSFVIINMRNIYIFQNSKHWNFCKLKTRENWLRLSCQVPLSEAGGFFQHRCRMPLKGAMVPHQHAPKRLGITRRGHRCLHKVSARLTPPWSHPAALLNLHTHATLHIGEPRWLLSPPISRLSNTRKWRRRSINQNLHRTPVQGRV